MDSKKFRVVGWILMIPGIIFPVLMILTQAFDIITDQNPSIGYALGDLFAEGIFPGALIILLVFLPGWTFYKISKKGKSNKLQNWALGLTISTLAIWIIYLILGAISASEFLALIWGIVLFGGFIIIPYYIAILLLVIDYLKNKSKLFK